MSSNLSQPERRWHQLQQQLVDCRQCSRLIAYGQDVAKTKRKSFEDQIYWGRPVPNFGDAPASLLVVGLAPAAHGAHRTGRMFTGDQSGRWLYRALHRFGFAETEAWEQKDDNRLIDTIITAVAHCAPPDNKPAREEIQNCSRYLDATLEHSQARAILCLGKIAWDAIAARTQRSSVPRQTNERRKVPAFAHGASYLTTQIGSRPTSETFVIGSYHPSQQNTFTGRLTEVMFDEIFGKLREKLTEDPNNRAP